MNELVLERRNQHDKTGNIGPVSLAPPVDDDYWIYRVQLSDTQAILGFPKFTTVGIGFAVEEDWNTNLPYLQDTEKIWNHIKHNKGDDSIPDERCIEAIRLVQRAAAEDRGV